MNKYRTSTHNESVLDPQSADRLLAQVCRTCNLPPCTTGVETLAQRRIRKKQARLACCGFLCLLTALFLFLHIQESIDRHSALHSDTIPPALTDSGTEEGNVRLLFDDSGSGLAWERLLVVDHETDEAVENLSIIMEDENTLSFPIPERPVRISLPDRAGNTLTLLVSPETRAVR